MTAASTNQVAASSSSSMRRRSWTAAKAAISHHQGPVIQQLRPAITCAGTAPRVASSVDEAVLGDLATRYGLGGAVRVMAWAADPNDEITIETITDKRDGDGTEGSGMGWGQIAKELGFHPGIGSIMGNGGGHGRDNAPGQQEDEAP
jgi:hypothetical protein